MSTALPPKSYDIGYELAVLEAASERLFHFVTM